MKIFFLSLSAVVLIFSGCVSSGFNISSSDGVKDKETTSISFDDIQFNRIETKDIGIVLDTQTDLSPRAVLETDNGDVILITVEAKAQEYFGPSDIVLVKIDPDGNVIWKKKHQTPVDDMMAGVSDAIMTSDGNIVLCGWIGKLYPHVPALWKFNSEGEFLWLDTAKDNSSYSSVIEDDEGHYLLLSENDNILKLVKYAGNGILEGNIIDFSVYNISEEYKRNLFVDGFCQLPDNKGYMVTGEFSAEDLKSDLYLAKFNSDFEMQWTKVFDYAGWEKGANIQLLEDNTLLSTALLRNGSSFSKDITLLQKLDLDGEVLWKKEYYNMGSLKLDSKDSHWIIGSTYKDNNVILFNSDVHDVVKWVISLGPDLAKYIRSVKILNDGSAIFIGNQPLTHDSEWVTTVVYKLDPDTGKMLW
ncbi:MAG: hypothetical protein JEY91_07140 [Spirochaetaceae bacterium]|nr:hypothetical protein [Spirochaetaceae bacterium]